MFAFKKYYYLAEKYFSDEFCDRIIDHAENSEYDKRDRQFGYRDSEVIFIPPNLETKWLYDPLYEVVEQARSKCWRTIKIDHLQAVQYTIYNAPGGKYNWHSDMCIGSRGTERRILSMVVQLADTDTYTGGEFEISECAEMDTNDVSYGQIPDPEDVKTLRPPRGSVIIFPSFLSHRVLPVTKGTRKSLVGWCDGRFI